jgi:hypothetical protein
MFQGGKEGRKTNHRTRTVDLRMNKKMGIWRRRLIISWRWWIVVSFLSLEFVQLRKTVGCSDNSERNIATVRMTSLNTHFTHTHTQYIPGVVKITFNKKFWEELIAYFSWYDTGHIENDASKNSSIFACVAGAFTLVSCWTYLSDLKMEAICSPETSDDTQRMARRYISEDSTLQLHKRFI